MEERSYLGTDTQPVVEPSGDEKSIALLAHVLTLVAPILAPLIIYLVKKDESAFVSSHAKESLNFQLTVALVCLVLIVSIIGVFLIWIVAIASLVLVIVATIKASEGKLYQYPFRIRFLK